MERLRIDTVGSFSKDKKAAEASTTLDALRELEKRIKDLETMEIDASDRLTALEAKVKEPCWRITGSWQPITRQPPDTCGTCVFIQSTSTRLEGELGCWRFNEGRRWHMVYQSSYPACPHHERREA